MMKEMNGSPAQRMARYRSQSETGDRAASPENQALGDQMILTFHLAGQTFGLPVTAVSQVIDMVAITPLPNAPPPIQGIINVRGRMVSVMDLRLRFGLDFQPYLLHTPIILTEFQDQPLGLVVDGVETVMEVAHVDHDASGFFIPTALRQALGMVTPTNYLAGVVNTSDQIVLILDLESLLSREELEELMNVLLDREGKGAPV